MTECFLVYDHYLIHDRDFMVLACFRQNDRKLLYIRYSDAEKTSIVGNVYAARIEKKVSGVGLFLVIPGDIHVFVREKNCHDPFYIKRQSARKELCEGDLVLVQIEKDSIKTKEPEGTFTVSIKTPDFLITRPGNGIHFSKKLSAVKKEEFSRLAADDCALLIRTAASEKNAEELSSEIKNAEKKLSEIFSEGKNHTGPALVAENDDLLNRLLTSFPFAANDLTVTEIKTSDRVLFERLGDYGSLYTDEGLSLLDLYRIRTVTENLLKKTVWLKSGSNIVIEQTEALTVIDVNSAKSKKSSPVTVNREAAEVIMDQIRLRNISGIIVIDFMKMHSEDEKHQIISLMKTLGKADFARITVEDFTKLGLLEMTREKIFPSVSQTLTGHLNYGNIANVDAQ